MHSVYCTILYQLNIGANNNRHFFYRNIICVNIIFSYNIFIYIIFRFIDSNYTTVQIVNVTDWMNCPYLLQQGSNYDQLLRGLLSTEGRLSQPSYNPLVMFAY